MSFRSKNEAHLAIKLLEYARDDIKRSLDSAVGEYFWKGYQAQALLTIRKVAKAMHDGGFELPHPWDLRKKDI